MKESCYRIPSVEFDTREDLIKFLTANVPRCIFENLEEVLNPVGSQWNYTLTAQIEGEATGVLIAKYVEPLYEKPEDTTVIAKWLQDTIPSVKYWYKGTIKP